MSGKDSSGLKSQCFFDKELAADFLLEIAEKVRMFRVLLRRNRRAFRRDSFKEFMGVPCHRLVVRMVLHRLDCPSEFSRLKRMYYHYPWEKRLPQATVLRVFKNSQEGEQWLLQQQSNPT